MELHEAADASARSGDFWSSLRHAADILQACPTDHRARTKLALSLAALGQPGNAVGVLRTGALALTQQGYLLTALGMCRDAFTLAPTATLDDVLAAIHRAGRGHDLLSRPRVPPPVTPAVDVASRPHLELGRDALLDAAATLGREAPPEVESLPPRPLPFFCEMDLAAFMDLVPRLSTKKLGPGEVVVEEGTRGDALYVVIRGEVDVVQGEEVRARLGAGAFFGEMALVVDKPRNATVRTHQATELFEIHRTDIEAISLTHMNLTRDLVHFARRRLLSNVVSTAPIFQPFDPNQRREMLAMFESRTVQPGQVVITEGEPGSGLFVLMEGIVEVSTQDDGEPVVIAYLEPGDVFGEISLIRSDHAIATVTAVDRSMLLFLPRVDFEQVVEHAPQAKAVLDELAAQRIEDLGRALEQRDVQVVDVDDLIMI